MLVSSAVALADVPGTSPALF